MDSAILDDMASVRSFDAELSQIESLRDADPASTEPLLRKALAHRNNFIVAKAASLTAAHNHRALTDALVAAFHRFLKDGVKSDPQCWAKNAIVETLAVFECEEPEVFLIGLKTIQLEPNWGGNADTAGTLRGFCAVALVQCRSLTDTQVLKALLPLFADKQLSVRVNAARAVEHIGTDASILLLRLRAELASDEPELLGACYSGVLRLEGPGAIPWAAKFLPGPRDEPDDTAAEAAFAIAETRTEAAVTLLIATHKRTRDPDFRGTLLAALALTRQQAAIDYLFDQIAEGSKAAREALENSAPSAEVLERLRSNP